MAWLLDTCSIIWLATEPEKLSKEILEIIKDGEQELYLSICSVWELALKQGAGLSFKNSFGETLDSLLNTYDVELLPIDLASCETLTKLPMIHKDPFDRMIISQAISKGLTILTPDMEIIKYPVICRW